MRIQIGLFIAVSGLLGAMGCSSSDIPNGQQTCGAGGQCPSGFYCAPADDKCYKTGTGPGTTVDMAQPDLTVAPPDLEIAPNGPQQGMANVAGAVSATSTHYKVIMTTGTAPGGNSSVSTQYQRRGGIVGATQKGSK
jgi:hypothetical protein